MTLKYFPELDKNCVTTLDPIIEQLMSLAETKYQNYILEDGAYYTVFSALHNEQDEAHVHSKIIFFLLTRPCSPDGHDDFLKLFLQQLGIDKKYLHDKWVPFREKYFDNGRIDFVLESSKFCLAIEMKIDAADGPQQLERYESYCKSRNKEYLVFYLTLNGKMPSKNSLGKMNPQKLRLISFEKTIDAWLQQCLNSVEPLGYKHSFLMQYSGAVKYISKGDDVLSMKDYIKDANSAKAAMVIFSSFLEKMEQVLTNFMNALKEIIIRDTGLPTYLDTVPLVQFYTSTNNTWPGSYTEIDSIKNRQNEYCFVLKLEIEHSLYACLGFAKKISNQHYEWLDFSDMKKKHPEFYNKWSQRIEKLNVINAKKTSRTVWFFLQNSNGEVFNFKNYSLSVIELIDELDIQAEYVGDVLVNQIIKQLVDTNRVVKKGTSGIAVKIYSE